MGAQVFAVREIPYVSARKQIFAHCRPETKTAGISRYRPTIPD
jgi:hypothetical protein